MTPEELLAEFKSYYRKHLTHAEFEASQARRDEIRLLLPEEHHVMLVKWLFEQLYAMGDETVSEGDA